MARRRASRSCCLPFFQHSLGYVLVAAGRIPLPVAAASDRYVTRSSRVSSRGNPAISTTARTTRVHYASILPARPLSAMTAAAGVANSPYGPIGAPIGGNRPGIHDRHRLGEERFRRSAGCGRGGRDRVRVAVGHGGRQGCCLRSPRRRSRVGRRGELGADRFARGPRTVNGTAFQLTHGAAVGRDIVRSGIGAGRRRFAVRRNRRFRRRSTRGSNGICARSIRARSRLHGEPAKPEADVLDAARLDLRSHFAAASRRKRWLARHDHRRRACRSRQHAGAARGALAQPPVRLGRRDARRDVRAMGCVPFKGYTINFPFDAERAHFMPMARRTIACGSRSSLLACSPALAASRLAGAMGDLRCRMDPARCALQIDLARKPRLPSNASGKSAREGAGARRCTARRVGAGVAACVAAATRTRVVLCDNGDHPAGRALPTRTTYRGTGRRGTGARAGEARTRPRRRAAAITSCCCSTAGYGTTPTRGS